MSEFVDYKKRDIMLPPGCKDLSDILLSPRLRQKLKSANDMAFGSSYLDPKIRELIRKVEQGPDIHAEESVSNIGKFIEMVMKSSATVVRLWISLRDGKLRFGLNKHQILGQEIRADVTFEEGAELEQSVRKFFTNHNLRPPGSSDSPLVPFPGATVSLIWELEPLPEKGADLTRLVINLFREACSLPTEEKVLVGYHETIYPPELLDYFRKNDG